MAVYEAADLRAFALSTDRIHDREMKFPSAISKTDPVRDAHLASFNRVNLELSKPEEAFTE